MRAVRQTFHPPHRPKLWSQLFSSDVTIANVIDKLEVDKAGALVVTDDNHTILGVITERYIARGLKTFDRNVVDNKLTDFSH